MDSLNAGGMFEQECSACQNDEYFFDSRGVLQAAPRVGEVDVLHRLREEDSVE